MDTDSLRSMINKAFDDPDGIKKDRLPKPTKMSDLSQDTKRANENFESRITPYWQALINDHSHKDKIHNRLDLQIEHYDWGIEIYSEYYDGFDWTSASFKIIHADMDLPIEDFKAKLKDKEEAEKREKKNKQAQAKRQEKKSWEKHERRVLKELTEKYEKKDKK